MCPIFKAIRELALLQKLKKKEWFTHRDQSKIPVAAPLTLGSPSCCLSKCVLCHLTDITRYFHLSSVWRPGRISFSMGVMGKGALCVGS